MQRLKHTVCFRWDNFLVESFVGGLMSLSLHWGSCMTTEGDLFRFHVSTGISAKVTHIDSWEFPHLMSLGLPKYSPQPQLLAASDFHSFPWPSRSLSCLSTHITLPPFSSSFLSHPLTSLSLPPMTFCSPF